jgi:predicted transcriptional regulator
MTRTEAIARIAASLPRLSDEHVQRWIDAAPPAPEDDATRAAIANGIAQARRGEFATDAEMAPAYARSRK